MHIFDTPNYETMQPDEFLMESLRIFRLRLAIDKAILLEKVSRTGLPNCASPERAAAVRKYYTMDDSFDIACFHRHGTLTIHITPIIDENGCISFDRRMFLGDKEIPDKYMELRLYYVQKSLRNHIMHMGQKYHYNRSFKQWPNVYRH